MTTRISAKVREEILGACAERQAEIWRGNVIGYGVGTKVTAGMQTGCTCVSVLVSRKLANEHLAKADVLPATLGGWAVDVVEAGGRFRIPLPAKGANGTAARVARPVLSDMTDRHRPFHPGNSVAHPAVTAGTLGAVVVDVETGRPVMLSNNHVFANSNDATVGDPILQPGPADGGRNPLDRIGALLRFVPILFQGGGGEPPPSPCPIGGGVVGVANAAAALLGRRTRLQAVLPMPRPTEIRGREAAQAGDNRVDAAIASIDELQAWDGAIPEIGVPGLVRIEPDVGEEVQTFGRTAPNYSAGAVRIVDATIIVDYGTGLAQFRNQVLFTAMSEPGDSGSLICDMQARPIALLFAGSEQLTIGSPAGAVEEALGVAFVMP